MATLKICVSTGIVGSVALGGLAVVVVSAKPVPEGFAAGGWSIIGGLALGVAVIVAATLLYRAMKPGRLRAIAVTTLVVVGFFLFRALFDKGVSGVEAYNPATYGNIGGFGLVDGQAGGQGAGQQHAEGVVRAVGTHVRRPRQPTHGLLVVFFRQHVGALEPLQLQAVLE